MTDKKLAKKSSDTDVSLFLEKVAKITLAKEQRASGRLVFGMDATASRQLSWDTTSQLQGDMFLETTANGGLQVQLVYFRGFKQFICSDWVGNAQELMTLMTGVSCLAGETQIRKLLKHSLSENNKSPIDAIIFIGDAVEEDIDVLGKLSGQLGILGVPIFIFQDGSDPIAEYCFKQITQLSNGAYAKFDVNSKETLKELLRAVAVFTAGGKRALKRLGKKEGGEILKISNQISKVD